MCACGSAGSVAGRTVVTSNMVAAQLAAAEAERMALEEQRTRDSLVAAMMNSGGTAQR